MTMGSECAKRLKVMKVFGFVLAFLVTRIGPFLL